LPQFLDSLILASPEFLGFTLEATFQQTYKVAKCDESLKNPSNHREKWQSQPIFEGTVWMKLDHDSVPNFTSYTAQTPELEGLKFDLYIQIISSWRRSSLSEWSNASPTALFHTYTTWIPLHVLSATLELSLDHMFWYISPG
jgi:hypothetical protein